MVDDVLNMTQFGKGAGGWAGKRDIVWMGKIFSLDRLTADQFCNVYKDALDSSENWSHIIMTNKKEYYILFLDIMRNCTFDV